MSCSLFTSAWLTRDATGHLLRAYTAPHDTSSGISMGNSALPTPSLNSAKRSDQFPSMRPTKKASESVISHRRQQHRGSITSVSSLTDRVGRLPSLSAPDASPELEQSPSLTASLRLGEEDLGGNVARQLSVQRLPPPASSEL